MRHVTGRLVAGRTCSLESHAGSFHAPSFRGTAGRKSDSSRRRVSFYRRGEASSGGPPSPTPSGSTSPPSSAHRAAPLFARLAITRAGRRGRTITVSGTVVRAARRCVTSRRPCGQATRAVPAAVDTASTSAPGRQVVRLRGHTVASRGELLATRRSTHVAKRPGTAAAGRPSWRSIPPRRPTPPSGRTTNSTGARRLSTIGPSRCAARLIRLRADRVQGLVRGGLRPRPPSAGGSRPSRRQPRPTGRRSCADCRARAARGLRQPTAA
jgi:hypothetical protein